MKELIKEIYSIPGVAEACVFCKSRGTIYCDTAPDAILNREVLQTVGMHFVRLFQMGGMAGLNIESSHFYFKKYVVIGIAIDANSVALIICEAHINCSLVTTTVSMLASEIKDKIEHDCEQDKKHSALAHAAENTIKADEQQVLIPYFESIEKALAAVIGPVAGIVLRDSQVKWKADGPEDIHRLQELVDILKGEIGDDALAADFQEKMLNII